MSSRQIRRLQNLILASEGEDYDREDLAPSMMQSKNAGKKKNKKVKGKTEEEEVGKGKFISNQGNCDAVGAELHEHHHEEEHEPREEEIMENLTGQENEYMGANTNVKESHDEAITNKNNSDNNKSKNKAKKQLRMKKRQALAEEDALLDALLSNAEQQRQQPWQHYNNESTSSSKTKERKSNCVDGAVIDQLQARETTTTATTTYTNSKKGKQISYTNRDICTKVNSTAASNSNNNNTVSKTSNTRMSEEECLYFDLISYLTNCDTTRMNTRLERIRAFGPASVEDIGDGLARNNLMGGSNGALSSSAAANNNSWSLFAFHNRKLSWKTNVFVSPNRYRWFPYDNLGVHLGLLNEDNKNATQSSNNSKESNDNTNMKKKKDKSHKTKKNISNNKLETNTSMCSANRYPLRYVLHCEDSPAFQRAEHRLQECIAFSPQPNTLLECLLVNKVYHLPSLKACYSMLMAMNETNKAGELADCAMYHVGEILKFFPLNGDWRRRVLPYYWESNPHIYWALKVGADVARSRGCMRTTWEMHKLILSLNPHDPIRVLSVIDIPALQAKRWMWLVELMENAKRIVECEEERKRAKCKRDTEPQNDKKETLEGEKESEEKASTTTDKDPNMQWNIALARRLYLMPHLVYNAALAKHCLEREMKNVMTRATSPLSPSSPTLPKERTTSTNVKRHHSNSNDMSTTHDVCACNRNSSKVLKELSNTQWEDLVASIPKCCKSNYNDSFSVSDNIRIHTNDKCSSKYNSAAEMLAEAMVQFPLMAVELVSALQGVNTIVTRCGWQIAPANYKSRTTQKNRNNENNYTENDHDVRTEMRMKEAKVSDKVQGKHDDDVDDDKKSESKMVFVDIDAWSEIEDAVNVAREHNSLHSLQQMCDFTSELVKNRVELWKPTEMLQLIAQVVIIQVNSSAESILAKRVRQAKQEMQKHLLVRSTPLKFSLNREKCLSSLMDALEKKAQESTKRIGIAKDNDAQFDKEENAMVLNLMKINENDTNMMQTNNDNNAEEWTERAIAEMLIHYSQGGEISFMNSADAAFVQDPNELMNMMAGNNNQANANEEEQEVEMIYGGDSENDYEDISFDDNDFIEDTSVD